MSCPAKLPAVHFYELMAASCCKELPTKSIKSRKAREGGQPAKMEIHAFYTGGKVYSIVQAEAHLSSPIAPTLLCHTVSHYISLVLPVQAAFQREIFRRH